MATTPATLARIDHPSHPGGQPLQPVGRQAHHRRIDLAEVTPDLTMMSDVGTGLRRDGHGRHQQREGDDDIETTSMLDRSHNDDSFDLIDTCAPHLSPFTRLDQIYNNTRTSEARSVLTRPSRRGAKAMRRLLPPCVPLWLIGALSTLTLVCLSQSSLGAQATLDAPIPQTVQFNRDVRPILSDKCFTCHGPSSTGRRANLRLDDEASAKDKVIVPGDPEHSLLIQRIRSTDPRRRMPRQDEALSERDVTILTKWIEQGASYEPWWSFVAPVRPELPEVEHASWPKNGIDYFILDRLEQEGLRPSPEADRATIIRRVTLDLTGLPPTPAEVDAFLADESPDAYEKLVDRLLASPRYGERMASTWMAVARFADTLGYQADYERDMHRWRDWVIDAFNRNLPFDQFTTEQLAGDLLPHATQEQITATGFNRLHRMMAETGSNPDEYWVENVLDRTTTMGTTWLGLTLGCARCHDHKYDPITQQEVYQFYAFFNNNAESGVGLKGGNAPPVIAAPTPEQQVRRQELEDKVRAAEKQLADLRPEIEKAQREWERSLGDGSPVASLTNDNLVAHFPLSSETEARFDGTRFVDGGTTNRLGPQERVHHGGLDRTRRSERSDPDADVYEPEAVRLPVHARGRQAPAQPRHRVLDG